MKAMSKRRQSRLSERVKFPNEPPLIRFSSHLLQANYAVRTLQELLEHSDLKTTMIYTHTVQSVTIKQAKSPLDF
jgi:site-specific recombinase XerC